MTAHMYWNVDPSKFMSKVDVSITRKTLEVSEEIFDGVVEKSPVRTGSFRASWNVTVNQADESIVRGGSPEYPLRAPVFPKLSIKPGDKIIINNSTVYGPKLENGYSDQAPLGMVSVTLVSLG